MERREIRLNLVSFSFCFVEKAHRKEGLDMTGGAKLERDFQSKLIKEIKDKFDGCMVMKLDSSYIQGIPDLLILHNDKWATLECKRAAKARRQPNQEYYVGRMNEMSFSRFICPENKEEVLRELQSALQH